MKPSVGAVRYLNAKPLTLGLEQGMGNIGPLYFDHPAGLVEHMKSGDLDLALLPVVALLDSPELEIIPGLAIGCDGPVRSVLLLHRVPLENVRTVALDPESRSSNLLTQVLFKRCWQPAGPGPRYIERDSPAPLGETAVSSALEETLEKVDAAVRIGDKALGDALPEGWTATDLGYAWKTWTGLPFVFAVWMARPGAVDRPLYKTLHESKRAGRQQLEAIVEDFALDRPERKLLYREYLTHSIRYRLGAPEIEALNRFLQEAFALNLVPTAPVLRFAFGENSACHDTAAKTVPQGEITR